MSDSTTRKVHVIGQVLSTEQTDQRDHYNQLLSKEMRVYFTDDSIRRMIVVNNVLSVLYPVDDKDNSLVMMNYLEIDTVKMHFTDRWRLEKAWTPRAAGASYPMSQVSADKERLSGFAWLADIGPKDKDDAFCWRGKERGNRLRHVSRQQTPPQ